MVAVAVGAVGVPVFYFAQRGNMNARNWVILGAFFTAWVVTLIALLWRGLSYRLRALGLVLVAYILNTVIFIDNGVLDSSDAWMLISLALAFVLLGIRSGILVGGGGNLLLYAAFALAIRQGWVVPKPVVDRTASTQLIIQGIGHVMSVGFLSLILFSYSSGWLEALKASSVANKQLEAAMLDLQVLNTQLDQRVIERTRQLAERTEELAEALAKNEAILTGIADGVIVFDPKGKAISANPAIGALLERSIDEIVGRDVEALIGEEVDASDREMIGRLLRDWETAQSGFKFRWHKKTFAVSLAPVRDVSGEVFGTVAVFRDFTREAEIDRMKSTFVAIASHDLRTPLTAIVGYTDMLYDEDIYGALSKEQHDVMRRILANTKHMMGLASNLLDQAQIEAGTLALNIVPFCPRGLVEDVVDAMDILAQAKGLSLIGKVTDDVPATLVGDEQRLCQILMNLVGNAIKFTDKGLVRICVHMPDEEHWALEVVDTGPGISPEAQAYVFDPFRRADDLPIRQRQGVGLGLSIVKQLVDLMSGEVRLESEVGQGSTFAVVLPLDSGAGEAAVAWLE
jgi:PAS domain S-box-containing protein